MDVFSLREQVVSEYQGYVESFLRIRDERIGNLEAVSARATGGEYVFDVTVIRIGGQVYRFLTAIAGDRHGRCRRDIEAVGNMHELARDHLGLGEGPDAEHEIGLAQREIEQA